MEGVFDGLAEGGVDAVGEEAVEAGAFIDLVEVGDGLAAADDFAGGVFHRGAVAVVEGAFDEVGGGKEVLEALLVLDADGLAAVLIGDAAGGDVGFALPDHLFLGEFGFGIGAEVKGETFFYIPREDGVGLGVGHLGGAIVEGGLGEAFFENAGGEEELVGDDGVIHAHAAFVEDAHDGFAGAEVGGDGGGGFGRGGGDLGFGEGSDVGRAVLEGAFGEPCFEAGKEEVVFEIFAPEGGIGHAGFGEGAVEVEHADEAGPGAGPVGHGEEGGRGGRRGRGGGDWSIARRTRRR